MDMVISGDGGISGNRRGFRIGRGFYKSSWIKIDKFFFKGSYYFYFNICK